jgi:hypothetical protein
MQAYYRLTTHIPANHRLEITLPESFPDGEAEVIVLTQPSEAKAQTPPTRPLEDFLLWLDQQPAGPHSEEEIAAWIQEERAAWGED